LYGCVTGSDSLWDFALRVIRRANLFDSQRVLALLASQNALARRRCIHVVTADPPSYSVEDLPTLQTLSSKIAAAFAKAPTSRVNTMWGEKEVWTCSCGTTVKVSDERCARCGLDQYGFSPAMMRPDRAVALLNQKIETLHGAFRVV
jgi:hypothetical protein